MTLGGFFTLFNYICPTDDTTLTLLLNGSDNVYLDGVATLATHPVMWVPLYAAIFYCLVREHDFRPLLYIIGGLALCVFLSDQIASSVTKPLVQRYRPTHEPMIMHLVDTVQGYRGGTYGFCSSHAANTAAIATYLSCLFRHRATTLTLTTWTVINCWTRIYLGVHYVGDIGAGLLLGIAVGYTVHRLRDYLLSRDAQLGLRPQDVAMHPSGQHQSHRLCHSTVIRHVADHKNRKLHHKAPHYSTTRLSVITNLFILSLVVVTIPWRLCF